MRCIRWCGAMVLLAAGAPAAAQAYDEGVARTR